MQVQPQEILWFIGRLLLGGLFVVAGIRHFFIIPLVAQAIAQRGVPAPKLVLVVGSLFEIVAGLFLVLGILVVVASFGLIVFTVAASIMLLNFWSMQGPARDAAFNNCLSNLAVIGGLLVTAAHALAASL